MRIIFLAVIIVSALGAVLFGVMALKSRGNGYGKKLIVCIAMALIAVLSMPAKEAPSSVITETHITQSPVTATAAPAPVETDAAQPESTDDGGAVSGRFVASSKSDKYHCPIAPRQAGSAPKTRYGLTPPRKPRLPAILPADDASPAKARVAMPLGF